MAAARARRADGKAVYCTRPLARPLVVCRNLGEHGGGNFKLAGAGDFEEVSVQRFGVRGSGTVPVTSGGRGRLIIESVCDRWAVKAVAP